ncbi:cell cycle and development regulator domain-containing protein [Ditylenchus destructor]|nr:cell cycle and development regulator domain-containing protein [Ditylenchus destructor]
MLINRELVEDASHKTVIVLDRSPNFAAPATQSLSVQIKDEQGAQITSQLKKTLWNCSVESSLEFHRIVTDLFPQGTKQLRFVVSDFAGRFLTPPWKDELIRYEELLKSLATCDIPQTSGDASSCSIINGISMAVEQKGIAESEQRKKEFDSKMDGNKNDPAEILSPSDPKFWKKTVPGCRIFRKLDGKGKNEQQNKGAVEGNEIQDSVVDGTDYSHEFANRGTIVVLTSIDSSEDYNSINESITEQITMRNDSIKLLGNQNFLVVDKVKLIVVNVLNAERCNDPKYSCLSGFKTSSILHSCLISVPAGPQLVSTMHKVLQDVYDLISTTVSGVPMKEEAQQGQSVNYDVELLHHRNAHSQLAALGFLATDSKILNKAESGMYNTTRLKWCTAGPKLKSDKFPLLQSSCLLTPAYVNSRPTVCLTSFVLSGKCVMLEVDRSSTPKGQQIDPNIKEKLISHYLSKDEITGGLIIQCVAMGDRATLNGALTTKKRIGADEFTKSDLNYAAMIQLMNAATLVPTPCVPNTQKSSSAFAAQKSEQAQKLRENVAKLTEYFPTSLRESFIFNIAEKFEPIFSTLKLSKIGPDELEKCKKFIYTLIAAKAGNEALTLKTLECSLLPKGYSKDDQYRIGFEELAKVMKNFSHRSAEHEQLFTTFVDTAGVRLERRRETSPAESVGKKQRNGQKNVGTKRSLAPPQSISGASSPLTAPNSRSNSPQTQKRFKKPPPGSNLQKSGDQINLLEYFNELCEKKQKETEKTKEWVGWEKFGADAKAHLYPNLPKVPAGRGQRSGGGDMEG